MKSSVYATRSATRVNRTPAPIRWNDGTRAVECGLALAVLAAMTALPLVEIAGRAVTGRGVSGTKSAVVAARIAGRSITRSARGGLNSAITAARPPVAAAATRGRSI